MANNSLRTYWRKQLTLPKITFSLIFHGIHVAIFVIGWYALWY